MSRRGVGLWLCALLALPLAAGAQEQDFSKVQITRESVATNVYMLTGQGGNIGVSAGPDGLMVIDDQYAPLEQKIQAALKELRPGPVRFVLNTHWHPDHTGGNEWLGKTGAMLIAHDAARARLAAGMSSKLFPRAVPPAPAGALPTVTFSHDLTFHWNGDVVHVKHVENAHTDGDAIVHFTKANAMHLGDTFVSGRYPFIDIESGGSMRGLIAATDAALAIADTKTRIIPGHGPLSGRAELQAYRDVLERAREAVSKAIGAGQKVEDLIAARPLADLDPTWGAGFIKPDSFLRLVYASLQAEQPAR
jgi:glyoxylase-like metal-dependent hydrolase (beta-lactamase superfamily II)